MLLKEHSIYVAGHRGMVGSALVRRLQNEGYSRIITRTHAELDLTNQAAVNDFFQNERIDAVLLAAAKVGGIHANNTLRADFIYRNLMIQCNVIHAAYKAGIQRLLFLGSSCIYPRQCPQPMKEEYLLSGYLEPTNAPYAIAKIAGINMCESYNRQYGTRYRAVMPTNLYGPNDNFDLQSSHVLPAMIRKLHLAKLAIQSNFSAIEKDERLSGPIPEDIRRGLEIKPPEMLFWGTGSPRREFLHVDDMAAACLFVMQMSDAQYQQACASAPGGSGDAATGVTHLNIGYGSDVTLKQLCGDINAIVGFEGDILWDATQPDGMPKKLMDSSRLIQAGWQPKIDLQSGIQRTYTEYLEASGAA
ncbi:MAG: GDP-L-fucose synthase [Desulfobacteraceae bacterium]|jgi:GDP-L-fucose synthase